MQYDLMPSNRKRPKPTPPPRGMIDLWSVVRREKNTNRIQVFATWCREMNAYMEADRIYLQNNDRYVYVAHRFGVEINGKVHVTNMSPVRIEDFASLNLADPYAGVGELRTVERPPSDNLSAPQYIAYCGSLELGTVTSEKGKFSFRPRARFAFIKAFTCAGLESVQERLNHSIKMMKSLLST